MIPSPRGNGHFGRTASRIIAAFIAMMTVFSAVLVSVSYYTTENPGSSFSKAVSSIASSTSYADTDCDKANDDNIIYKQFKKEACKKRNEDKSLSDPLGQLTSDNNSYATSSSNIMSVIFKRILNPMYYLNDDVNTDNADSWQGECSGLGDNYSTSLSSAHCDIPGIFTEALQDVATLIQPQGIQNGEKKSAKTAWGIGVPVSLLPTDDVPVVASDRVYKYTGLETFGYNLQWTRYNGEWDYIKVYSSARLKTAMGIGDAISVTFKGLWTGMKSAANGVYNDIASSFGNDDYNKMAEGLTDGGSDSTDSGESTGYVWASSALNGYEENAVKKESWYRPTFVSTTVYGARSLTDFEVAALSKIKINDIWNQNMNSILSKYKVDRDSLETESAVPSAPNKTTSDSKDDDGGYEKWSVWKERNQKSIDWAKTNINLDVVKYDAVPGTAMDKYNQMKSDWSTASKDWVQTKIDSAKSANFGSIVSDIVNVVKADNDSLFTSKNTIYCADENNQPVGVSTSPLVQAAVSNGLRNPGKEALNDAGEWQCGGNVRPTIVGGLFGSSGTEAQKKKHVDTRRTAWRGLDIFYGIVGSKIDWLSSKILGISQWISMIMNELVSWSFEPILKEIGFRSLATTIIISFRETIYMNLMMIFLAFAMLSIIVKFLKMQWTASFQEIGMTVLTVALGVIVLYMPDLMFTLVDDVPSAIERSTMAAVFSGNGTDKICTATGSAKNTSSASDIVDLFGKSTGFNPDGEIRTMQCDLWEVFVLNPWSYGQFGTSINQLYANGKESQGLDNAGTLKVSADVAKIVGDAGVNLGGGDNVNNWGIYQLAHQLSGTSTTEDNSAYADVLDKNLYRIVDAQAGPDNAAGRDTSHFSDWVGSVSSRTMVSLLSLIASGFGLVAIGGLALKKIEFSILGSLLLVFLPFMMLIGILPGSGRMKLKNYAFEILSLAIKRIFTVLLLSVGIEILLSAVSSTSSFGVAILGVCVICMIIIFYGRELTDLITMKIGEKTGSFGNFEQEASAYMRSNPVVTSAMDTLHATTIGTIGAGLGYAMTGSLRNPNRNSAKLGRAIEEGGEESVKNFNKRSAKLYKAYNEADTPQKRDAIAAQIKTLQAKKRESDDYYSSLNRLSFDSFKKRKALVDAWNDPDSMTKEQKKLHDMIMINEPSLSSEISQRVGANKSRKKFQRLREGRISTSIETINVINAEERRQIAMAKDQLMVSVDDSKESLRINDDLLSGFGDHALLAQAVHSSQDADFRDIIPGLDEHATAHERSIARYALNKVIEQSDLDDNQVEMLKDGIAMSDLKDSLENDKKRNLEQIYGSSYTKAKNLADSKEGKNMLKDAYETKRAEYSVADGIKDKKAKKIVLDNADAKYAKVKNKLNEYKKMEDDWVTQHNKNLADIDASKDDTMSDAAYERLVNKENDLADSMLNIDDTLNDINTYRDFVNAHKDKTEYSDIKKAFDRQKILNARIGDENDPDDETMRLTDDQSDRMKDLKDKADTVRFRKTDIGHNARVANEIPNPVEGAKRIRDAFGRGHQARKAKREFRRGDDKQ
jgi:hypothetical protein